MYRVFVSTLLVGSIVGCIGTSTELSESSSAVSSADQAVSNLTSPTPSQQRITTAKPDKSRYQSKPGYEGLYYVVDPGRDDERKLIISYSNEPIEQKPNDPDEATVPGFYPSHLDRLDFSDIEVVGNRIYFKTRPTNGLVYEFRGTITEEIDPNFDPKTPVPGITGVLKTSRDGKVVKEEKVTLGHAVIA